MEITSLPRESLEDEQRGKEMLKEAIKTGIKVELKDVSFAYGENPCVFTGADLEASSGEIVGLIGPSGQGKTTTLRILLGLYHCASGSAIVSNPTLGSMPISSGTRCLFSYIPQGNTLFSGTIAENMRMLKPDATDEEIIEVLKVADAYSFIEPLEDGIDTDVLEAGSRFSEGQKQRLSIARALFHNAPILLLDEATSALDMATERRMLNNILAFNPMQTIIVTAHRPSVLSMCDRVYKIQSGHIEEVNEDQIQTFLNEG